MMSKYSYTYAIIFLLVGLVFLISPFLPSEMDLFTIIANDIYEISSKDSTMANIYLNNKLSFQVFGICLDLISIFLFLKKDSRY